MMKKKKTHQQHRSGNGITILIYRNANEIRQLLSGMPILDGYQRHLEPLTPNLRVKYTVAIVVHAII